MLVKETAEMLGKVLPKGITVEELTKAITSEDEVTLKIPEGRFFSVEDEAEFESNIGKAKYEEGGKARTEMQLKEMSKKAGFEETIKDPDVFIEKFKKSILDSVDVEPNKKLAEKDEAFNSLQQKYETDIKAKENEVSDALARLKAIENNSMIDSALPDLKDGISKADAKILFNSTHEIKEDGIYKNGKLLVNDYQSPLELAAAAELFVKEKGWGKEVIQGHGGKSPTVNGTTPKSYGEFQKYCESKGIKEASMEAKEYLRSIREKNPQFEMN